MSDLSAPVLVTGAAGKTGRAVIGALARRGAGVRAFVRRADQEASLRAAGAAEAVVGDLLDRGDLKRAMGGALVAYHICPNVHPAEVEIGEAAIDAAREAGVRRFVYHSVLHPQVQAMPHHWRKARVEERLTASNLPFTILQPCAYMQNLLRQWNRVVERGELEVPYDVRAPMSVVDLADVAAAAATVILEPRHEGATYELCGPESLTSEEMAEVMGRHLGRPVRAKRIEPSEWAARARAARPQAPGAPTAGLSEYAIDALVRMFRWYDANGFTGSSGTMERLLGRPPASFDDFVGREAEERYG